MIYHLLFNQGLSAQEAVLFFLISVCVYFISLSVHEFAHAFMAVKMGDPTPKLLGRMTLNPLKHLDMSGFFCFMFLGIGWAKPVPVNPLNYKKYKTGTRVVALAGVVSNLLLGLIAAVLYAILLTTVGTGTTNAISYVYILLEYFMLVNSFMAMFNFLPIYPMDGFNFVASFMKIDNNFIKNSVRNGFKIMMTIVIICLITELLFGFDLLDWYLSVLYNYVFIPIASLGV